MPRACRHPIAGAYRHRRFVDGSVRRRQGLLTERTRLSGSDLINTLTSRTL
ncbi:hypothetical protein BN903_119 [Halorubrum sp. AJ67]|nr:hypothetical protein BN903_119 [Halorubrum sp. AJ67]